MCNLKRVEQTTVGDLLNDNRWYEIQDGPKHKYCKLLNIIKIYVNINGFIWPIEVSISFLLISIINDTIWFLTLWVKRVSSKQ